MAKIEDAGCPLPHAGYAPEEEEEYSRGAWMAPPVGANGNRSVCDECVGKIENGDYENYTYDVATGEVKPA